MLIILRGHSGRTSYDESVVVGLWRRRSTGGHINRKKESPIPLIFVDPKVKINSQVYIDSVLRPLIEKYLLEVYPNQLNRLFVHHDAATSHTSAATQKFIQEMNQIHGIRFINNQEIPVKSPDASPLDFFGFGYLKQRLKVSRVTSLTGLHKKANEIWMQISIETIAKVYDSWHRRLLLIEYNQGLHIEHCKQLHKKRTN